MRSVRQPGALKARLAAAMAASASLGVPMEKEPMISPVAGLTLSWYSPESTQAPSIQCNATLGGLWVLMLASVGSGDGFSNRQQAEVPAVERCQLTCFHRSYVRWGRRVKWLRGNRRVRVAIVHI